MRYFAFVSLMLMFVGIQDAHAQRIYKHRSKTSNKCCLKGDFGWADDKRVGSATVIARADPIVDAELAGIEDAKQVRFHVPVSAIKLDRVSLDRIGLVIFSTGEAKFTGILNQNGGVDGGLIGSNVTIRARAYAGVSDTDNLADAIMVWETNYDTWVWKNRPKAVIFSKSDYQDAQLKRFFQEITHMEIEVEYTIDR